MAKGPEGQIWPTDAIGCAAQLMDLSIDNERAIMLGHSSRLRRGNIVAQMRAALSPCERRFRTARAGLPPRWK